MSVSLRLRGALDHAIVQHPAFKTVLQRLDELILDHQAGAGPSMEMLVGPSRIGKTEILARLAATYPERRENGRLIKPVLFVAIPSGTSPKDLPLSVMQALGVPLPRERIRTNDLLQRMLDKLQLAQTMVILFDEASHLVDVGSRIPARQASDWFKALFDSARTSIVLSGVPRLQRLLDSNEQLRGRCQRPLELMPYRWDRKEERMAFAGCTQIFLKQFADNDCPIDLPSWNKDTLTRHLYALSAGNIGLLTLFFKALARHTRTAGPIGLNALQTASTHINLPANSLLVPFRHEEMPDEHLLQLLTAELATYDIELPIESPAMELAAHRHAIGAVPV